MDKAKRQYASTNLTQKSEIKNVPGGHSTYTSEWKGDGRVVRCVEKSGSSTNTFGGPYKWSRRALPGKEWQQHEHDTPGQLDGRAGASTAMCEFGQHGFAQHAVNFRFT